MLQELELWNLPWAYQVYSLLLRVLMALLEPSRVECNLRHNCNLLEHYYSYMTVGLKSKYLDILLTLSSFLTDASGEPGFWKCYLETSFY
jgi:hypothetical protein